MTRTTETGSQTRPITADNQHSPTDSAARPREIKRRSAQACQSCRTRKIRCDITANNGCCTNCKLDQLKCVVLPSKRGAANRARRSSTIPAADSRHQANIEINARSKSTRYDSRTAEATTSVPELPGVDGDVPACVTFDEDGDNVENGRQCMIDGTVRDSINQVSPGAYQGLPTPETRTSNLSNVHSSSEKARLPVFIAPLPNNLLDEDLEYLQRKGAFTVPEHESCVEILRTYVFSVHPFMPVLNVEQVVEAVLRNQDDSQISLLLFQAVMFAGLHSLQLHVIHRLGFESAKAAREVFFDRVRLLYDFNAESDSTAILQSLILMSSFYSKHSKWNERRHTWDWVGLAYDLARCIGLHRESTPGFMPEKTRRFRRRLWWSLYIRDRMIALGTRRPMRIRDDEFDVTMLTLEDLEAGHLEELDQAQQILPTARENKATALMCIQLVKLCICIGHVVSSQYTTLATRPHAPHTMMVMPRRDGKHLKELEVCDNDLTEWRQALELDFRQFSSPGTQRDPGSCSEVQWMQLNIAYWTTVNVLHRAQALQPLSKNTPAEAHTARKASQLKVKDAARSLTRLGQSMLKQDHLRFLGNIGVTAFLAASLTHMLDIGSTDDDVRDASTFRLYQNVQALQSLSLAYASADAAISFLTPIARQAGISVPGLSATHAPAEYSSAVNSSNAQQQSANNLTPTSSRIQSTSSTALLAASANTAGHSAMPLSSWSIDLVNISENNPPRTQSIPQLGSTASGEPSSDAVDEISFDWVNGIGGGVDLVPMSFNFDFYSDALESLNSHF